MARLAVTLTLIFSLFLLSHARLQPNEPENQLVEWNPLNDLTDSNTEPKILLPSDRFKEDPVLLDEVAEFESINEAELSPSDDFAVESETSIYSDNIEQIQHHKKHKKHGFHFRFPFGFHKRCHHKKDKQHNEEEVKDVAEFESIDAVQLTSDETGINSIHDEEENNHHHHHHHLRHKKDKKHCFHFQFRFPFLFHKPCHHHHHHHHKNHTECHHHHHQKNHTDCHHHHKNHSHWEKEDKEIAGEGIPSGNDMNNVETIELLHGDSTEGMRSEEGKKKHHHHKKEGKKEKKHGGLMKFFHKLFKHFY